MGFSNMIGKYQLVRTIGEGTFAKVKLAINTINGEKVAIKIIDKHMIKQNNLICQVKREIRTMKLLSHPNIVQIHEVIGTKTKIYIVMEYVPGGPLSDKMSYIKRLEEKEARKYFQQLIDAVGHCHRKGVYHRDIKPQNLLLDGKGNIKVSDFGLSTLAKASSLLSTTCGSPSYVSPELLSQKGYEGRAADIWSCGVVLFELLAGYLPFDDSNLTNLYRKIYRAKCMFPRWFTEDQKKLISRILDPNPKTRITIAEIFEDEWFQMDYKPVVRVESKQHTLCKDDRYTTFNVIKETEGGYDVDERPNLINAFRLIAMSHDLDLSRLFEEEDMEKEKITLGSKHTIDETIEKIKAAAEHVRLSAERIDKCKLQIHPSKMIKASNSYIDLTAQVVELAPNHCAIEITKSEGELRLYKQFCKSLSSMLTKEERC
ncbi:PREDICTED: CBL-interacting serine/threonine-protein kinase 21 [Nicotiana attenuata]|uniref:non-specific serine/threonine protein kinase n=1 Tax=Nicotiana attenuata TaxID=49451 RepID=A0A1J6ICV2_NICAT|nr:PREDICTED: CBL-interacting serine/threonine-protein kinase 21 [Nicotiana attenuata]OIS96794.1 cbl-interacting serinethreonine-protein kinase 21 [Nicotiana attenuata]